MPSPRQASRNHICSLTGNLCPAATSTRATLSENCPRSTVDPGYFHPRSLRLSGCGCDVKNPESALRSAYLVQPCWLHKKHISFQDFRLSDLCKIVGNDSERDRNLAGRASQTGGLQGLNLRDGRVWTGGCDIEKNRAHAALKNKGYGVAFLFRSTVTWGSSSKSCLYC